MTEYPYMVSNNKIAMIFDKIKTAAKPQKMTAELLKQMGFASSNDRAFINILKKLEFLSGDGVPTVFYDELRDETKAKQIIAKRIKTLYKDIFALNTNMHMAPEAEVKGAISRVTGKEENDVKRMYTTFKTLCNYADFSEGDPIEEETVEENNEEKVNSINKEIYSSIPEFHYNIQIHLPATTDISVYNAIFKSLKENLL